ncbi:hypothetical protein J0K78_07465 [Halobacillus sp. GSS1]|uniref:hypothetical protein n=1 Tax=Halobacillus sp. GSS1 TaxID=2815919 RepID=UPI001A8FB566|nr:hypothetical protein [Halobacillus sp. GSS1]MBN9654097.1 hypothetical protein [Halobacillus sp. GSS1]
MWGRLKWGFITALGYLIISLVFSYLIVGEPNLSLILGLTSWGFISGVAYLNPPPKKWRES